MNFDNLVEARSILRPLWKKSDLRGRCWGLVGKGNNPYARSNITFAMREELVSVCQSPEEELVIHEFVKTKGTSLGAIVRNVLLSAKLPVKDN